MKICNIFFKHKNIHRYIWEKPFLGQKYIIDYIIIKQKTAFKIQDVKVEGLNCRLEHNIITSHIYFSVETISTIKDPNQTRKAKQWSRYKLFLLQ